MKVYILEEISCGRPQLFEFDSAIWSDLNELDAFLSNLMDDEYIDRRRDASNSWDVYSKGKRLFHIIEVELNSTSEIFSTSVKQQQKNVCNWSYTNKDDGNSLRLMNLLLCAGIEFHVSYHGDDKVSVEFKWDIEDRNWSNWFTSSMKVMEELAE